LASEWHPVPFGRIAEIYDGPHATPAKTADGPVFLGISNLSSGRLALSTTEHLSEDDYRWWTRRVVPRAGDVVFSYETRLGEAALIPTGLRCCLGRRMGLARAKPECVDARFLLYAYLGPSFQATLRARTVHGSTVDRILLQDLPKFPIAIPASRAEQEAIAGILGALDDKIELNRRTNETLEAMARALFKSWFVDFDPVHAWCHGQQPRVVDRVADLFPKTFETSNGDEVPKGWTSGTLYETATFINGAAFASRDFYKRGEGLPVVKIAELKDGIRSQTKYSMKSDRRAPRIETGDLLYSWSGNPDTSLGAYIWLNGLALLNQHIFKVVCSSEARKRFEYLLLKSLRSVLVAIARNKQTIGLGHVTVADMKELRVAIPSHEILSAFDGLVGPLLARAQEATFESQTLSALRDALLPKLISGELRIKDAEEFIARRL